MSTMYSGSVAISCECVHNGFSIFYQTICSIHFVIIRKFRGRVAPYQNTYKLLKINGFESSASCKGNVSANRMQSDESLLSRAMLRCSLTSPEAMVSQPRVK